MTREIGSEFWGIPVRSTNNFLFPKEICWFLSGRSALLAIIRDIKAQKEIHTVALPSWCCDSMIKPFVQEDIQTEFYNSFCVDGATPGLEYTTDVILVMDYFGYSTDYDYSSFKGIVIRDLTHGIFSGKHNDANYYYGSLRKWAGFCTGGYAWGFKNNVQYEGCNIKYIELRKKAMMLKKQYIETDIVSSNKKIFLDAFSEAEKLLEDIKISEADDQDIESAKKIDVFGIKKQRRNNAQILLKELGEYAIYKGLMEADCPLFVPIIVKNRNEIRRALIDNRVYCPIHWSSTDLHSVKYINEVYYTNELSLVCDQRYTEGDMIRLLDVIEHVGVKGI